MIEDLPSYFCIKCKRAINSDKIESYSLGLYSNEFDSQGIFSAGELRFEFHFCSKCIHKIFRSKEKKQ